MVTERDVNKQFFDFCGEEDDLEAAGKQMALEESIMTVREEGFSDIKRFDKVNEMITPDMYQPQFVPDNQVFFEIPRCNIKWCCDEFKAKAGRNTKVKYTTKERIHGITRWHINCPYCGTALIASKYSMKPEK